MDNVGDALFSQPLMPTDLQDLLMCESYFDDFTNTNLMDHDSTTALSATSPIVNNDSSISHQNLQQQLNATTATTLTQAQQIASLQAQIQALVAANSGALSAANAHQVLTPGFSNFSNNWDFANSASGDNTLYESPDLLANVGSPDSQPSILSNSSSISFPSPSDSSLSPPYSTPSPLDTLLPDINMASSPPNAYPCMLMPALKEELDHDHDLDHDELKHKDTVAKERQIARIQQQQQQRQQQQQQQQPSLSPILEANDPDQTNHATGTVATKKRRTMSVDDAPSARKIPVTNPPKQTKRSPKADESPVQRLQSTPTAAINIPAQFPSRSLTATPSLLGLPVPGPTPSTPIFNFGQLMFPNLVNHDTNNKLPIQRLKPPAGAPIQVPQAGQHVKQKKVAHNAIERRYRNNINDRISDLKNVVPALYHAKLKDPKEKGNKRVSKDDDDDDDDDDGTEIYDGVAAATKLNKATILRKATEYIVYLKKNNEQFKNENAVLRSLVMQLPGGLQMLEQYQLQESEREFHQLKKETSLGDDSGEDSESSGPTTPPSTAGGRVMMALFMAVSFVGATPMSTWNSAPAHHHQGKALGDDPSTSNASGGLSFNFMSDFGDSISSFLADVQVWTAVRFLTLFTCLAYFCFPPSWFRRRRPSGFRFGSKKSHTYIKKARGTAASSTSSNGPRTIYYDLVSWLPNPPPQGKYALRFGILREGLRLAIRHVLGFDFGWYGSTEGVDEETLVRTWMRLSEIECLGGNPHPSKESLLYTCLKTLNVVETVDDEIAISSLSRVYANAAIQMTLAFQGQPAIARRFTRYFWALAMYSAETDNDDESAEWLESLLLDVHDDDRDEQVKTMVNSKVWDDALSVMKKRFAGETRERGGRRGRRGAGARGQIVQSSSNSTIPIEILSGFQSFHNLYTVFQHLIVLITSPPSSSFSDTSSVYSHLDSTFDQILMSTASGTIAHWYAVVGAAVESFWKDDVVVIETLVRQLKDLPKNSGTDLSDGRAFGESTKKAIGYTLIGVAFVKCGRIIDGIKVLEKARKACSERRRIYASNDDLESNVQVLAEFVTGVCGLEAWINIWRTVVTASAAAVPTSIENEKASLPVPREQSSGLNVTSLISTIDIRNIQNTIGLEIAALRRKMETQPLNQLDTTEDLLRRLCELGEMIYNVEQFGIDSGCESVSDGECEAGEQDSKRMVNVGERALRILKGYKV